MPEHYIDFETLLIKPGVQAPPPVCLSVCLTEGGGALFTGRAAKDSCSQIVKSPQTTLVASNIPFEFEVMSEHWGLRPWVRKIRAEGRARCTETQERLLNIFKGASEFRVGLAALVKKYLNQDISQDKGSSSVRLKYSLMVGVSLTPTCAEGPCYADDFKDAPPVSYYYDTSSPDWSLKRTVDRWPKEFAEYAIKDAQYTRAVHQKQLQEYRELVGNPQSSSICDIGPQVNAKASLHRMRSFGVFSDSARVKKTLDEFSYHRERLWSILVKTGIAREDGSKDMKALRKRVEYALGEEVKNFKSASGQTRTDRATIALAATHATKPQGKGYVQKDGVTIDVVLEALSVLNTLDKFISAYLVPLDVPSGSPIHWRYTELVNTGRTSASSAWESYFVDNVSMKMRAGTNFQNFPTPRSVHMLAQRIAAVENLL